MRLTRAGEILLPYAETLLQTFEQSRLALNDARERGAGNIRLGASTLPATNILPELLAEFKQSFPAITFEITVNLAAQIRQMVQHNQLDLGIIGCRGKLRPTLSLNEHLYLRDETVVVVSGKHEWADRKTVEIRELSTQPLILSFKNTLTRQILEEEFRKLRIPLRIEYEIRSTEIIKRMVEQELGVSVLGFSAVRREAGAGWLKCLSIKDLTLFRDIAFIYRRDKQISPTLRLFVDFLSRRSPRDGPAARPVGSTPPR